MGYTILGPVENIQKINSQMLRDYVTKHYTGSRMVIAASGAVDHDALVSMAEKYFGSVATSDTQMITRKEAVFVGSDFQERWDEMPRAYFALAYPTPGTELFTVMHNSI